MSLLGHFEAVVLPLLEEHFGQSIAVASADGAVTTITAVVSDQASLGGQPYRVEQRANHLVSVQTIVVTGSGVPTEFGSAVRWNGELYDFVGVQSTEGVTAAVFERVTILDTGAETGDL